MAPDAFTELASPVDAERRGAALAALFAQHADDGSAYALDAMRALAPRLAPMRWRLWEIDAGAGGFLAPVADDALALTGPSGVCTALSATAAGVVATLAALARLSLIERTEAGRERLATHHDRLRQFAERLPEWPQIQQILAR